MINSRFTFCAHIDLPGAYTRAFKLQTMPRQLSFVHVTFAFSRLSSKCPRIFLDNIITEESKKFPMIREHLASDLPFFKQDELIISRTLVTLKRFASFPGLDSDYKQRKMLKLERERESGKLFLLARHSSFLFVFSFV
jgi:hypothetical protein